VIRARGAGEHDEEREPAKEGVGHGDELQKAVGQAAGQPKVRHGGEAADGRLGEQQKERQGQREHRHALVAAGDGNGIQRGHTRRYRLGK